MDITCGWLDGNPGDLALGVRSTGANIGEKTEPVEAVAALTSWLEVEGWMVLGRSRTGNFSFI